MANSTDPRALPQLAEGLSAVAVFLEAKPAGQAAATLSLATTKPQPAYALHQLARGLSAVAARLEAKEAAAVCGPAAATLGQTMTKMRDPPSLQELAQGLSAVAARMEPKEAAAACAPAAATLSRALTTTEDPVALVGLARGLSALAARIEPKEAAAVCAPAVATLSQVMTKTTRMTIDNLTLERVGLPQLAQALSALAARMGPEKVREAAANLSQAMSKAMAPSDLQELAQALSAVLLRDHSSQNGSRRCRLIGAAGALSDPGALLIAPALLQPALEPPPPPLPAQTLVDLLKQPFCVGEARRLVLGQLARHYQRPFTDQWELVRFAKEQPRGLDLLTPPQWPGRDSRNQEP
jgi:hypothetical protein